MNILDKYNKKRFFEYDKTKEREYINLQNLFNLFGKDKVYVVHALFINKKSRFGDSPIIVTSDFLINAPKHLLETVQEMMNDSEVVRLINARKVGFKIYSYRGKNGMGYSVEWVLVS